MTLTARLLCLVRMGERERMGERLLSMVARAAGARRAQLALSTNGVSSVGNFALAVAIARNASLTELGEFGVAFSIYALLTGLTRSAVAESVLSLPARQPAFRQATSQVLFIAILGGLATACLGAVLGLRYLIAVGLALPGLALYDYLKVVNLGVRSPGHAMAQECIWTSSVLIFIGSSTLVSISPLALFTGWSVIGAVIGLAHAFLVGASVTPRWKADRTETCTAAGFGTDYLISSGMAQLTPSVLALVVGNGVVGSLRGAATLLGPVALVASTARTLLIPYLAAAHHLDREIQLRRARRTTVMLVAGILPFAVAVTILPDGLGRVLLGSNWEFAEPLMPPLALELLFAMAGSVPFAGHRAGRASGRTLRIRAGLAPIRLGGVVAGSIYFGAEGAAYSMALLAILSFAIWWVSYTNLVSKQEGAGH